MLLWYYTELLTDSEKGLFRACQNFSILCVFFYCSTNLFWPCKHEILPCKHGFSPLKNFFEFPLGKNIIKKQTVYKKTIKNPRLKDVIFQKSLWKHALIGFLSIMRRSKDAAITVPLRTLSGKGIASGKQIVYYLHF